jgi:hypothetical protein
MPKLARSWAAAALVFGSACATPAMLRDISSGHVGCLPDHIEVSNIHWMKSVKGQIWEATCEGKRFLCSSYVGDTACTQVGNEVAAAASL